MATAAVGQSGRRSPRKNASTRFTLPAAIPFTAAIHVASTRETLRVRLLSMPHAKQAPSIAKAGSAPANRASPGQLKTTAPAAIAAMPNAIRWSKFSLKTTQASNAVKTPSAFNSRAAPEAGMPVRPNIKRTGPTTPPERMAPANQPVSPRERWTGAARVSTRHSVRPIPEPR